MTPAHETAEFGELVCSNSLKSESENTAPWLLKQEMRRAGSELLKNADLSAVPAGHALAVDRVEFSRRIAEAIANEPRITVYREEVTTLDPEDGSQYWRAAAHLVGAFGRDSKADWQRTSGLLRFDQPHRRGRLDRYGAGVLRRALGQRDCGYINCPMTREEYDAFYDALMAAETSQEKEWEKLAYFQACIPIEGMARSGRDTLRFGPMKPVGLRDPRTGKTPHAVVQLRCENLRADSYNLVGFQNHLKYGEQARILRMIPGLEKAKFLRYGQIHRNTYINAPTVMTERLTLRAWQGFSSRVNCQASRVH